MAILSLLRDLLALPRRLLVVFSDSQFAIKAIRDMQSEGCTSGVWHAFAPFLSHFPNVTLRWIPGHVGILGNEITDRLAKRACELVLEPGRISGVDFGFWCYTRIREQRLAGWRLWHTGEGHHYYCGSPRDFRHLRSLTRMDMFALIRIRSGTGLVGHNNCPDREDRHHSILCDRYATLCPPADCLYDNRVLDDWIKWFRHHDMQGLGIPANLRQYQNVTVAFDNPFDATACIVRDGRRIGVDIAKQVYRCEKCHMVHAESGCPLPAFNMPIAFYFLTPGSTHCPVCGKTVSCLTARNRHYGGDSICAAVGRERFWHGVKLLCARFTSAEKGKLAVKWFCPKSTGQAVCFGCHTTFTKGFNLSAHLRKDASMGCRSAMWIRFLTDCDADGDDDDDKLLIFRILGWDEMVDGDG